MKYGIDIGHNCPPDIGATGIKQEDTLTMEVGNKVVSKLKALGHQVVGCRPASASSLNSSLQQRCNTANASGVDRFVSIHFNKFNGQANGTEVFAASDAGKSFAKPVVDSIAQLGYVNRGVKDGSHLYVIANTNMPAILVECCFCDSKKDMDLYNAEALATAIVKGLTGTAPQTPKPPAPKTVLDLQKALNRLKVRDANGNTLKEDGTIDDQTIAATKKFQAAVGITPTGVGGPTTWQAIDRIFAKPTLRENHASGTTVTYVQRRVGAQPDGLYGPGTTAAVVSYQKKQGLPADGIVGPKTWDVLLV